MLLCAVNNIAQNRKDVPCFTVSTESEFRPAKSARNGEEFEPDTIPDGFYLVGDAPNPQPEFQRAIIEEVAKVTHIAPPDAAGNIIGEPIVQEGVIAIPPPKDIGLCAGATNALYATTTEVYPDSPLADDDQCNWNKHGPATGWGALPAVLRNTEKGRLQRLSASADRWILLGTNHY